MGVSAGRPPRAQLLREPIRLRLDSAIDLQTGTRALGFPGSWHPQPVTPSYCQGNYPM